MSFRRIAVLTLSLVFLCACGPPVLDTSSPEGFLFSIQEIREDLEEEERAAFDEAFDYFTNAADLSRDPQSLGPVIGDCEVISGMSASEIVFEAWRTKFTLLDGRVSKLVVRRAESEDDNRVLAGLEIVRAKMYNPSPGFLKTAVVEVRVRNNTGHRVFVASFRASLRRPHEIDPWVVEVLDRPFGAGLGKGQEVEFRLEGTEEKWEGTGSATDSDIFLCEVMNITGISGDVLAESAFGEIEAHQLEILEAQLAELKAARPTMD